MPIQKEADQLAIIFAIILIAIINKEENHLCSKPVGGGKGWQTNKNM